MTMLCIWSALTQSWSRWTCAVKKGPEAEIEHINVFVVTVGAILSVVSQSALVNIPPTCTLTRE